ncbi:DUF2125 domain-containing protein [Aureimonas fodinaquatilis]|nr:DUF2125 domain-containing protein [Aureimonas fodinaquatilis]
MNASSTRRLTPAMKAMIGVVIVALLLAAGLTAGWFYLAGEIDRRVAGAIDRAAGGGATIECEGRQVFGYPFRIGLGCDAVMVASPASGIRVSAGAFRTAAQIYDTNLVISELTGPVQVDAPNVPPLELSYSLAQSSTHFSGSRLQRFSLAIDNPSLALRQPAGEPSAPLAQSARLEVHARQNGQDLDLAVSDKAVTMSAPGLPALPPFDLATDASITGGAEWITGVLPGGRLETALRGRSGVLRQLQLTLQGGGAAEISGPFQFSPEGLLTGRFSIAVENPQAIADLVTSIAPAAAGVANAVAGGIGFAGRQVDGRSVIDIDVQNGRARLGFIPLGDIPPL